MTNIEPYTTIRNQIEAEIEKGFKEHGMLTVMRGKMTHRIAQSLGFTIADKVDRRFVVIYPRGTMINTIDTRTPRGGAN